MTYLIQGLENKSEEETENWLMGDARLIVVAGSDTTATTLTHVFYYLAQNADVLRKLRESLEHVADAESVSHQDVQNIPYLDGIIQEALRLHPPVPSGVLRVTPAEGLQCCGVFIPGDTTVSIPIHALGRCTCFR